ncbi:arabinan endo-1,5-alpha-L-arabinosidase [Aspergillus stella-maris]|uniref:arabinan endo-1,5-alpha-L-arabinosidase n=1 Tax=Aspergillus stella-maris TaxID=1810926 RepID=UPI003CCD3C28
MHTPLPGLGLLCLCLSIFAALTIAKDSNSSIFSNTDKYPLPHQGNVAAHDPNILFYNNTYYLFKGGVRIPYFSAPSLSGPWENTGTILSGLSEIKKQNRRHPWAPDVIVWNDRFYCFYSISQSGERDSAIGLALSDEINTGNWTDHGAIIETGNGTFANVYPYNVSNAIDPAFFQDPSDGTPYLQYGSYWDGIFQLRLTENLTVENPDSPSVDHLVYLPGNSDSKPDEGSFVSYREPYYYTWFSYGQCCQFDQLGFPKKGEEYSIRIGRSESVHGPYVDQDDKDLLEGGGTIIYGSNHGLVYAPGGLGILYGTGNQSDILYYHYHNTSIGFAQNDARLGWNELDYVDGWPVVRGAKSFGISLQPMSIMNLLALLGMVIFVLV